jgi:hypothetical protein
MSSELYFLYKKCTNIFNNNIIYFVNKLSFITKKNIDEPDNSPILKNENSMNDSSDYEYYICNSFTSKDFYLINKSLTVCSCKGFKYYKEINKSCKHINYCKNTDLSKLLNINFKTEKCKCNDFLQKKSCKHFEYFKINSS